MSHFSSQSFLWTLYVVSLSLFPMYISLSGCISVCQFNVLKVQALRSLSFSQCDNNLVHAHTHTHTLTHTHTHTHTRAHTQKERRARRSDKKQKKEDQGRERERESHKDTFISYKNSMASAKFREYKKWAEAESSLCSEKIWRPRQK